MKKLCYVVTLPLTIRAFFIPQIKYLADNDFDVSVICSKDNKIQTELGNKVKYIPLDIPRGVSIKGSINSINQLIKIFKREKFDLIQYSTPNAALYASIAAIVTGCKVRNYHLMGFRYLGATGLSRKILKLLEIFTCKLSTHIECVSKSNLKIGVKEGIFPRNKATVVWHGSSGGVDIKRFDYSKRMLWRNQIRKDLGLQKNDFVFGFAGRITRDKGINELLKAFFSLGGNSKLLLIGNIENDNNTLDPVLFEKAKNSNRVLFHRFVNDIERYYAAMDIIILPSYREGFGMVIAEAAAVGTPAIVSNIPGPIDTIIDKKTALKVSPGNSDDLNKAMTKYLTDNGSISSDYCVQFIKKNFDSNILNQKILERKKLLLKRSCESIFCEYE